MNEFALIVQHVLSVCFRRIERLKNVSGTKVDIHMQLSKTMKYDV